MKHILIMALLLTGNIMAWAGDISQGTVSNATITFSTTENGTYTNTLTSVAAGATVYMKVAPASGYYITNADITLTKGMDIGSAQARRRTVANPGTDVTVTFAGDDPADLSTERTYTFVAPENGANVEVTAYATARTSIAAANVTAMSEVYTGGALTASVITVVLSSTTLTEDIDYTVSTNVGGTDVGSYDVEVTGKSTYTGTASGTFSITQAPNAFTTQPSITGWTYGDAPNEPTSAAIFGTPTYKYCADADGTYSTYEDIVNGAAGTWYVKGYVAATANYTAAESEAVSFVISQAAAVVNNAPVGVTGLIYTGNPQVLVDETGATCTGGTLVYSKTETGTYGAASTITETAAGTSYSFYYKVQADANHTESDPVQVTGISIEKVELTVKANNKTITYGDAPTNAGVTYTGFVNNETEEVVTGSLDYSYSYNQFEDVGNNYTITPNVSGLMATNYTFTPDNGTLTVVRREVTLDWSTTSLTYTGALQAPTATVTNTVNGDVIAVTVMGENREAGTGYTATASELTGERKDNYILPNDNTTSYNIGKADVSNVTVTGGSTYVDVGETELVQNPTLTLGDYTLTTDDYDIALENTTAVGTTSIVITGKGTNFDGTNSATTIDVTRPVVLNTSYDYLTYFAAEDLEVPAGYEAETITNADLAAGTVTASAVDYIPQEVAVILHKTGTAQGIYHLKAATGTAPSAYTGFTGVLTATSVNNLQGATQYILVGNEFVKLDKSVGGDLEANRCYLYFGTSGNARLKIMEDENATDIQGVKVVSGDTWYTLGGQKLNGKPAKKGAYIKDGKVVIIK